MSTLSTFDAWHRRLTGLLLVAGLAVLAATPSHADPADGDLRLRGGATHNEGRLEIFHDNEWGTICDDFFWRRDAKVACKQMGYTGAEAYLTDVAVAPDRRFWLDDVNCVGNEAKLTECFYNSNVRNSSSRTSPQWGIANCIPAEQVGVRCTASTSANSVEFNKSHLTIQEDGGGSRYTVRLGKAPTGNVTVAISGQSSTVLIDDTPLTFTTGNWSTPQTVTLTAADDSNRTDDSFTLTHTASGGGYGSVTASLSVTVEDDDGPVQAHIDSGGIVSLTEGGSRTYRIWLDSAPTEQVTVAVTAPSKVSVNPTSMTFTAGNWSTAQTVTLEASHDNDTSDETQYVTHRATKGDYTTTLSRVQVEITDDDDGEDQIGSRPSGAVWWAALTARRETGGATGHIDYTSPHADTGKLSNDSFTYGGVTRAIDGLFVDRNGHFQIWVDSGNGSVLPNGSVLHVGSESLTLGSATRQSFRTMYNDGRTPIMREHAYWWQSGSHGVSLSDRQVVAVWLEVPAGSELPGVPRSVNAQARDGKASLEWGAPPEVPSKPVTSYEYQQEGTETWNSTGGTATTKEVTGLANGASYTFRVRAVNAAGKGAASAPTPAVTPAAPGLTASFVSVPEAHDGSSAFTLRLEFSEDVAGRFRRMRSDVFEVTGGAVTDLRRVDRRRDLWTVTVTPSSEDEVTVAVPAGRACDVSGAVCTADGEQLSSRVEATVPGPLPTVSVSAGTSPVTEGTAAAYTLTRTGDTAAALTVTVSVSEDGAVLLGTAPTEAIFAAGSATVELTVATEDDAVAGDGSVVTVALVAGTGYALDADASAATVTVADDDAVTENTAPTGLPTIAGTARVGETLTAAATGIADADGLTNAVYAWQWIANDGTSDADIAGATGTSYTLTAAEVGKTVKVRVTFTDDGGTAETLVSAATAAVAALPAVSVAAVASPVTEGAAAQFTLTRTGDTAAALTVSVSVTQAGAVLSGTPGSTVTFGAGSAEASLSVATEDDSVAEADGRVTVTVSAGSGYTVDADAASAGVDVYDNDEAATTPTTAAETLWTSTLTPESIGGAIFGYLGSGNALSPNGWSEDGTSFQVDQLYYFPAYAELVFKVSAAPPELGQLTLHLDNVQVQLRGVSSQRYFYWTVADLGWQAGQAVAVKLTRTDPDAAVVAGPGLSVADAQVREADGAVLAFRVSLDGAQSSAVSVRYATSDGTAAAGSDYLARSGMLRFAPGETAKTVSVAVLNDAHDEGSETMTLTLSQPFGAELSDGAATGTIANTDPIPQAWSARFGRTVAEQVLEAVESRMRASRTPGVEVRLAGQRVGGGAAQHGADSEDDAALAAAERGQAHWLWQENDPERQRGFGARSVTEFDLLTGSSFSLTGGTQGTGFYALWGRGAVTRFDGREEDLSLDGEVLSGMLGADWARGAITAGLVVAHSRGEGSYRGEGDGGVTSSLTGLYPWGRYVLSERLSVWGVAGYGAGTFTLTQKGLQGEAGAPIRTDLDLMMAAAGLRGVVVQAPATGGFELAVKTDALGVRTSTAKARGLESSDADVTRLRVGLEGSRPSPLSGGGKLVPSVEIGVRHDGGDAETGFGVDIGGGLAWSDPKRGLSAELRGRGLLSHEAGGFEEHGFSGALGFDPTPDTERGLNLTMSQTVGVQAAGGMDALLSRDTLAGLAANDPGGEPAQRRLEMRLGYGLAAFGDRFTGTPEIGFGFSGTQRDYSLGWRLTRADRYRESFELSLEARRHEIAKDDVAPEHTIGFKLTARF